jgi:flagellar biosynthesis protein FliR
MTGLEFGVAPDALSGYLLALVRATAWVFVMPPFASRAVPRQVKVGLAAALALALGPSLAKHAVPLEAGPLVGAAMLQALAGLALGFLGVVVFAAFQAAGELIDTFSGFSIAAALDPISGVQANVFGRFYQLLATTLLFATNGHLLVVRGFLTSFDAAPLTSVSLETLASVLIDNVGMFFVAAVEIAGPLLAALFLAEVCLGLLTRAAPQMNVFILGLPLKILLTLSLAGMAIPLLPGALDSLIKPMVSQSVKLLGG